MVFKRSRLAQVLFVLPVIIIYGIIIVFPLIQGFFMSFTVWDGVNAAQFNGLANYQKLFSSPDLWPSIRNSILYSVFLTIYQIGFATIFAFILVNVDIRMKRFFKAAYFVPVLLSVTVVAQLFVSIYHGDFGLINKFAETMGWDWRQNWLAEPIKGILAIAFAESWKGMGYHMLIIYAAMRNVPCSYYEAARIDGASTFQQFRNITIPLTSQAVKVCFVMCITFGFRAFEMIHIMTGGGPGNYTSTMPIMMYKALFSLRNYGYSNAIAMFIVVLCVLVMLGVEKATAATDTDF